LRTLRSDLMDPTIAMHHGRIVKRTGDGSIIEFRSAVDAVRCAIEVQQGLLERKVACRRSGASNSALASTGDVVEESDGDLMGDGVNIPARLDRVVEIILKHDLLGLSVEALPGATPHPLIGRRWEGIEAQIGLPRIAGTGAVV
jgi:class 3 adenylate cyclase